MILHPRRAWSPHSSGSGKSAALGPRGTIHGRALLYVTVRPASLFSAVLPESAARTSSGCRRNFCRILQGAGTARHELVAATIELVVVVCWCWLLVAGCCCRPQRRSTYARWAASGRATTICKNVRSFALLSSTTAGAKLFPMYTFGGSSGRSSTASTRASGRSFFLNCGSVSAPSSVSRRSQKCENRL